MNDFYFGKQRIVITLIAAGILLFAGCNETSPPSITPQKTLPSVTVRGYRVPVFPSASEQFNYARSWFADPEEKKAALWAVDRIYPLARIQRGHAALELAYSRLGRDFRMADRKTSLETIAEYSDIIEEYGDLPEICAKAHWYIGWIHCDLIHERGAGIESYWKVVERYPKVRMELAPPVPWVSIVYPAGREADRPETDASPHFWAGVALVEIIRYSEEDTRAWDAFEILRKAYPAALTTGKALKLLLARPALAERAMPFAADYLADPGASIHLAGDIRRAMERHTGAEGAKGPGEAKDGV